MWHSRSENGLFSAFAPLDGDAREFPRLRPFFQGARRRPYTSAAHAVWVRRRGYATRPDHVVLVEVDEKMRGRIVPKPRYLCGVSTVSPMDHGVQIQDTVDRIGCLLGVRESDNDVE